MKGRGTAAGEDDDASTGPDTKASNNTKPKHDSKTNASTDTNKNAATNSKTNANTKASRRNAYNSSSKNAKFVVKTRRRRAVLAEDDEEDEEQEAELVLDDAPASAGEVKAQTPPAREQGRKWTSGANGGSGDGGIKRKRSKEGKVSAESVDRGTVDAESEEEEGGRRKRKGAKEANGIRAHEESVTLKGVRGGKRMVREWMVEGVGHRIEDFDMSQYRTFDSPLGTIC